LRILGSPEGIGGIPWVRGYKGIAKDIRVQQRQSSEGMVMKE